MPYKDPLRQREYQGHWQRSRRDGEAVGFKVIRGQNKEGG